MRRAIFVLLASGCLIGPQPGFGASQTDAASTSSADSGSSDDGSTNDTHDATSSSGASTDVTGGETDTDGPIEDPNPPGYESRPCGFDLDYDGIAGEAGECDVCDGSTDAPFPHEYPQHVFYIDCDAGMDVAGCGAPDNPCASLDFPADGVWNTEEERGEQYILCFRGTCPGSPFELPNGWTSGATTRGPLDNEERDFEYPSIPTVLAGWDVEGDGHPPWDDSDVAEIDLDAAGSASFLVLSGSAYYNQSHDLELAHFTVKNGGPDARFINLSRDTLPAQRIHLHDIVLDGVRAGAPADAERPLIELEALQYMGAAGQVKWLALENIDFSGIGGWVVAETSDAATLVSGPIRLKKISASWQGCDIATCGAGAVPAFWRASGYFTEVEIIDSKFDGMTEAWDPWIGGDPDGAQQPATAIVVGECNREFTIRNNAFSGFATAVRVEANSPLNPCNIDVGGIEIEDNEVVGSGYEPLSRVTVPFYVSDGVDGASIDAHVGGVRIVNNAVFAQHGWRACAGVRASEAGSGPIEFEHNTCVGALADPAQGSGHFWVRVPMGAVPSLADITLRHVLFAGGNPGDRTLVVGPAPAGWSSNNNVFDPAATFAWAAASDEDLAGWQAVSGGDGASALCVPIFVDDDDVHLAQDDACAVDRGADVDGVADDIDGDMRPMGVASDVGADERR